MTRTRARPRSPRPRPGGLGRARTAKLLVATGAGALLAVISLATAYATFYSGFTWDDLGAGAAAQVLSVVGGVAVGSLCARPIITRTAWSFLTIILVTVADVLIPYGPPLRTVLIALNRASVAKQWATIGLGAGEVVVVAALLIVGSSQLGRTRS